MLCGMLRVRVLPQAFHNTELRCMSIARQGQIYLQTRALHSTPTPRRKYNHMNHPVKILRAKALPYAEDAYPPPVVQSLIENQVFMKRGVKHPVYYLYLSKQFLQKYDEIKVVAMHHTMSLMVSMVEILKEGQLASVKSVKMSFVERPLISKQGVERMGWQVKDKHKGLPFAKMTMVMARSENFWDMLALQAERLKALRRLMTLSHPEEELLISRPKKFYEVVAQKTGRSAADVEAEERELLERSTKFEG